MRRVQAVSEGVRRPPGDAPGDADGRYGGDAAAGCGSYTARILELIRNSGFDRRAAKEILSLRRQPVEQVARFPETAGVRLGAEDDDSDLGATLRQAQQRSEAVTSLADESGLSSQHFDVTLADKLIGRMDVDPAAAGGHRVLLLLHHVRDLRNAGDVGDQDRKSTRLNSSHGYISYAVFCLKKKKKKKTLELNTKKKHNNLTHNTYPIYINPQILLHTSSYATHLLMP